MQRSHLIICVDCLRFDRFVALLERPSSRLAQALRRAGAVFERAYTTAPWTYPATHSLLTGLYPHRHGARHAGGYREGVDQPWPDLLDPGRPTLFSEARRHGHATVGISTIYWALNERCRYDGCDLVVRSAEQNVFYRNTPARWVVDTFIEVHEARLRRRPFTAYLHLMDLHRPYNLAAAAAFLAPPGGLAAGVEEWDARPYLNEPEALRRFKADKRRAYDALLAYVDAQLGRLFDFLERAGRYADTTIVVTADHGEEFWEHEEFERRHYACGKKSRQPWLVGTGHGHTLFDELIHVPLAVVNPPGPPPDTRAPVSLVDVFPTLLEWLGAEPRAPLDGVSLWRRGPRAPVLAEATLYGHERKALVSDALKCVLSRGDRHVAFYDLARDPRESAPLDPAAEPGMLRRLEQLFAQDACPS
jgi:arylsulfatase A-like enzyme